MLSAAIVIALAWGALAFGAVYVWAFTPLALGCASIGVAGLVTTRHLRLTTTRVAAGLIAIAVAISLQLVPVPSSVLRVISPGTHRFLTMYDLRYAYQSVDAAPNAIAMPLTGHALSIDPHGTVVGLLLFISLALFLLGATRIFSAEGPSRVVLGILGLGLLLPVLAVVQIALNVDRELPLVYGVWKPRGISNPFGPFINPNHYAGWMLMALPVVIGLGYGSVERDRLEAQSENGFNTMRAFASGGVPLLAAFTALVMAASALMTKSRSGMIGLVAIALLFTIVVARRQRSWRGKAGIVSIVTALLFIAIAWAGLDSVVERFRQVGSNPQGRVSAWVDTVQIIRNHPWVGTGFNTYRTAMVLYQTSSHRVSFQEAHNDYLQLASEGGLLVGLPVAFTIFMFVGEVRHRFREAPKAGTTYWLRVGAAIGMVAIALQSLVEFSLQMPGNAMLFALLAALALHRSPRLSAARHYR